MTVEIKTKPIRSWRCWCWPLHSRLPRRRVLGYQYFVGGIEVSNPVTEDDYQRLRDAGVI